MDKLIEQFNLPKYIKGKSFSDASKAIQAKFKDRKDSAATRTMEELLGRLKDAQEYTKQMQQAQEAQQAPQMEAPMEQGQPQMQQAQGGQYAMGGNIDPDPTDPPIEQGSGKTDGISNYRHALAAKVQANNGSFAPGVENMGDGMGHNYNKFAKQPQARLDQLNRKRRLNSTEAKEQASLLRDKTRLESTEGQKAYAGDRLLGVQDQIQFAAGGYTDPTDPKKKPKGSTESKINTTSSDTLKAIGEGMSPGMSPERAALYDKVQANEGSFNEGDELINDQMGTKWQKNTHDTYMQTFLEGKTRRTPQQEQDLQMYTQRNKKNDYYGNKRTNVLDRQLGVGKYLNKHAEGGYMGIGQGATSRKDGYRDAQMDKEDSATKTVDGVKTGVATALGPIGMAFRAVQGLGASAGNAIGGSGGAAVAGAFSPEEGTISAMTDKDTNVGEKILGTVPGLGSVMSKKRQDERARVSRNNAAEKYVNANMNQYAEGGEIEDPNKLGTAVGKIGQMAPAAVNMGQQLFGRGPSASQMDPNARRQDTAAGAASGAASGAMAGSAMGPYGAAVGGVVGGIAGMVGAKKSNKALAQAQEDEALQDVNAKMNPYADGGPIHGGSLDYGKIGPEDKKISNIMATRDGAGPANQSFYDSIRQYQTPASKLPTAGKTYLPKGDTNATENLANYQAAKEADGNKKVETKKEKKNYADLLRYAPAAMNAFQLATLKKAETENYDRLGDKYQPKYVNEKRMIDNINNSVNTDAASEGSGGSLSRYASLSKAMQLGKTRAVSKAYQAAHDANTAEDKAAFAANKDTNVRNQAVSIREDNDNARNRAAYDNNKSKLLSQLGNDLGGVGKEELFKKQAKEIYGYNWNGKYFVNKDGEKKTTAEMAELEKSKKKTTNSNMFEGYLNKKKKK